MAFDVIAGIALHAAFGYLKDQKFVQQALGKPGAALFDASINAADPRVAALLARRLHHDSPFLNRRLAKALRRAYLEALQFASVECRHRIAGRFLEADSDSWLDALNAAIAYEMKLIDRSDYLPPDSTLGHNLQIVMIESGASNPADASLRLEGTLTAELLEELSAPTKDVAEITSALAERLHDNLKSAKLIPAVPALFENMIVNGWIDEEDASQLPQTRGKHNDRVRWADLVRGFFDNALNHDEQLRELFFRQVLCHLAFGQSANKTLDSGPFRELLDERAGELRKYFDRLENQLQELQSRLEGDPDQQAWRGEQLEHIEGELTGLRTLLDHSGRYVMSAITAIGSSSLASEKHAAQASAGTVRIERTLERVEALLKARIETEATNRAARLSPERRQEIRQAYLAWLERELRFVPGGVTVGGRRLELPLDQVYVSLRGYPAPAADMSQARSARQRTARYEEPLALQERDISAQFAKLFAESVDLGYAFRNQRTMVVLGDPGSGKTTLSRWIALVATRAFKSGDSRLRIPAKLVDTSAPHPDELVELGPAHLPIFLRIADVEKEYARRGGAASLDELLCAGESLGRPVYVSGPDRGEKVDKGDLAEFLYSCVKNQQTIVFLDGLDELADPKDRKTMVGLIHRFLDDHFSESFADGNRLVVTSRIIGYELHPLRDSVSKFTVEKLKDDSIRVFSDAWHHAYFTQAGISDPESVARAASESFRAQVFNPSRGALRDLATNPLLLSLLCVVNQEYGQSLPESRAHLYRLIVSRGLQSLFVDRKPEHRAFEERIKRTLSSIATCMHSTTSSGMLPGREIRALVAQSMGGEQDEIVDHHFRMIVEGTGLLSERGDLSEQSERLYGFRHLTIEEYLAGIELIDDPSTASARLLEKSADPRWREPVLLGLGELSESEKVPLQTFTQICRELLRPRSGLFPVGAILLAQAIRDFAALPPEVIEEMAAALLSAYGVHEAPNEQAFGEFVEDTIAHLLRASYIKQDWRRAAERAIHRFVAESVDNVQSLSRLIQRRGLYLEAFAEPLLAACRLESADWPIHEALEKMASSRSFEALPLAPVSPAVIARLKPETVDALKNTKIVESVRYTKATEDFGMMACSLPSFLLPMRELVERNPAVLERVRNDPHWLALLTPIFGGLGNFDTARVRMELRDGRAKIGSEAIDDMVEGRIAALLDTRYQLALERARRAPAEFRADYIYCDSPLTPRLSEALLKGQSALDCAQDLRGLWEDAEGYTVEILAEAFRDLPAGRLCDKERAKVLLLCDILLVLAAVEELERHPARAEPHFHSHLQRTAIDAFRDEAARLRHQQEEILFRSKSAFEGFLTARASEAGLQGPTSQPEPPRVPAQTALWVPDDTPWAGLSMGDGRSSLLGQLWVEKIIPNDSRASHQLAVFLDVHGKELVKDPVALSLSWMYLNADKHSGWPHPRRGDAYFRHHIGAPESAKYLYSLSGIDAIPHSFDFLKVFALRHIADDLVNAADLRPLLVGLALPLADRPRQFAIAITKFSDGETNPELLRAKAMQEAAKITDPLLRFWSCRYLTGAHQAASEVWRQSLLNAALEVPDKECRIDAVSAFITLFRGTAEANKAQSKLVDYNHITAAPAAIELPKIDETDAAILAFAQLMERRGATSLNPQSLIAARPKGYRSRLLMLSLKQALLEEIDDRAYSLNVRLDTSGKVLGDSISDLIEALAESVEYAVEAGWDRLSLAGPSLEGHPHSRLFQALIFLAILPSDAEALVAWALKKLNPHLTVYARDLLGIANLIGAGTSDRYRPLCMPPELVSLTGLEIAEQTAHRLSQMEDPWTWFHTARFLRKWAGDVISATSQMEAALVIPSNLGRLEALQLTLFENAEALLTDSDVRSVLSRLRDSVTPEEFAVLRLVWGLALPSEFRIQFGAVGSDDLVALLRADEQQAIAASTGNGSITWLQSRIHPGTDPAEAAALASMSLGLRLDAVVPERADVAFATFLDQPNDSSAWRKQMLRALRTGIHMTVEDAQAVLGSLQFAESTKKVEQFLPFIRSHDQQVTTALQEWAGNRGQSLIGKWASVMLVEEGHWNPSLVSALLEMVRNPNDLLRNRAWMQLAGKIPRTASGLRLPVLLALAQGRFNPAPQVSLTSSWAFESILFDDPTIIRRCVEQVESHSPGFEFAGQILGSIKQPSLRVVQEMLNSLEATHEALAQRRLMKGLISSWFGRLKHSPTFHPVVQRARELINRFHSSDNPDVADMAYEALGFFADDRILETCYNRALEPGNSQAANLHALAIAAEERGPAFRSKLEPGGQFARLEETLRSVDEEVAIYAGELFLRAGLPVEEIRERLISDDIFVRACAASLDRFFQDDHFRIHLARLGRAIGSMAARHVDQRGYDSLDLLSTALRRLKSSLEGPWLTGLEGRHGDRLSNLLPLCAAAAEVMPDLYRRIAETFGNVFPSRLKIAAERTNSFPARQAALTLLALTRVFSGPFAKAILNASTDVHPVQRTLLACVDRFREIDDEAVADLNRLLEHPSANVAFFATRVVLAIVSNETLPPQRREHCRVLGVDALTAVLEKVTPFQVVSLIERSDDDWTPRVRQVGFLRDLLREALVALSSVDLSDQRHSRGDRCAVLRFRTETETEQRSFDLRIAERPPDDPISNQRIWLQADFRVQIPEALNNAVSDLRSVAQENHVSCAELMDQARRDQLVS